MSNNDQRGRKTPKYMQIVSDLKKKITEGYFESGSRLPSITQQAKNYDCSKGTVIKAYEVLISMHIIYSKPQSGFYVGDDFTRHEVASKGYDFSTGNPRVEAFPMMDIKHSLNIAVELYREYSLELENRGTPSLLKELVSYLETENIYTNRENLFLSLGVTQVLSILYKIPFPNGQDTILIEEPTFSFTVDQLLNMKIPVETIGRTEHGIDTDELEEIFKTGKIKFFYTIPRNHNPLGTTLPYNQRKKIIELAHEYGVYIVENDYYSESFKIAKYDTLYYMSDFKNVIYVKSYTKLIPYIRIGFTIIPDELISIYYEGVEDAYFESYYMPALVSQATLESSIKSGILQTVGNDNSDILKEKHRIYNRVTAMWDHNILRPIKIESGLYTTVVVHKDINVEKLIQRLLDNNIRVGSNKHSYYNQENYDNSIRLSLSRICPSELETALLKMFELTHKFYME